MTEKQRKSENSGKKTSSKQTNSILQQKQKGIIQSQGVGIPPIISQDIMFLQETIGNQAVNQLMKKSVPGQTIQKKKNNTGLPDKLKNGIEELSGLSMDDVRVYRNSPKPASVDALAYTRGREIYVGPGQEKHLAHEAWHVAQQKQGRVKPTGDVNGMPLNDSRALEHEADVMGNKALQMKSITGETTTKEETGTILQKKEEVQAGDAPIQMGKKKKVYDYANPTRHGSQAGRFVGDPSKVHIHIVGGNTHIRYGQARHNFDENDEDSVEAAYNWLGQDQEEWANVNGYASCLTWLRRTYRRLTDTEDE